MNKIQMIDEALDFSKTYFKIKSWHNKHAKELFSITSLDGSYNNGTADASQACYVQVLNIIKEQPNEVSEKFVNRICEEYKKTVACNISAFLSIDYMVTPGMKINDKGNRTVCCPYPLPKDYEKYAEMCM